MFTGHRMSARRYQLACLAACVLFACSSVLADKSVSCYDASASGTIARGCVQISFTMIAFAGTIGNATFPATTGTTVIETVGDGTALNAIPYTRTSAANTLIICEVR